MFMSVRRYFWTCSFLWNWTTESSTPSSTSMLYDLSRLCLRIRPARVWLMLCSTPRYRDSRSISPPRSAPVHTTSTKVMNSCTWDCVWNPRQTVQLFSHVLASAFAAQKHKLDGITAHRFIQRVPTFLLHRSFTDSYSISNLKGTFLVMNWGKKQQKKNKKTLILPKTEKVFDL